MEIELEKAEEEFRERKSGELEKADRKVEKLRSDIREALDELDETLEELEGYEDTKGRTIVEDVMDNIVRDRRKMIDRLSLPEELDEIESGLEEFFEKFQAMKQKEAAVMEEVKKQDMIASKLGDLKKHRDRISDLMENEYRTRLIYQDLKEAMERREELVDELENIDTELQELELEDLQEEKREAARELESLRGGEEWQEYEELGKELEEVREQRRQVRQQLGRAAGKMERGLKKLLYQVRNGDLEMAADTFVLEKIRDGEVDELLELDPANVEEAVEEAVNSLPGDLIGESQEEKFLSGSEAFRAMEQKVEKLSSLDGKIESLEERLGEHPVLERERELEKKINQIEHRIDREEDRREELEQGRKDKESELDQLEDRVRKILASSFNREVELRN